MAESPAVIVAHRRQFYKDNYRRVLVIVILSVLLNFLLGGVLFYLVTHPPKPQYFATTINGRITPLFPLDQPNQSDSSVLQWANEAAIAAFSYNFLTYQKELQAASEFFTPQGWRDFLRALDESNNLDAVKAKKLIVSAVATRAPIILQKGILNGRFSWRIQLQILVRYQSASEFTQEDSIVTLLITRVSTLNSPRGIGIAQFVVSRANQPF